MSNSVTMRESSRATAPSAPVNSTELFNVEMVRIGPLSQILLRSAGYSMKDESSAASITRNGGSMQKESGLDFLWVLLVFCVVGLAAVAFK